MSTFKISVWGRKNSEYKICFVWVLYSKDVASPQPHFGHVRLCLKKLRL
jgi:hypothetical protein